MTSEAPPDEVLLDLANGVTNQFECEALRIRLKVDANVLERLLSEPGQKDIRLVALKVLQHWARHGGGNVAPTRRGLYEALSSSGQKTLAKLADNCKQAFSTS